jgi:hypothetical protein
MASTMIRITLAALTLLAGCGQDIDLGNSRMNVPTIEVAPLPPSGSSSTSAEGCPFEDPALLKAPDACPGPSDRLAFASTCVVTSDGPVPPPADALLTVPACPTGVYFILGGTLPPAENIERSLLVLKGDDGDKSAFAADTGTPLPRTIEVFADRRSFFVRLDPRPSAGLRVNVVARCAELFQGMAANPCGYSYAYVVGFHAGGRPIP